MRLFWLTGFCLPLLMINLDFMRLFRNVFVVSAICFIVAVRGLRSALLATGYSLSVLIYVAACFVGLVFYTSLTDIIGPIFSRNVVLGLL